MVNLCKNITNSINRVLDRLSDEMLQTAVCASTYTPIAIDVVLTQSTVACNNHAEESRTTRPGMPRADPSLVAALVNRGLDG